MRHWKYHFLRIQESLPGIKCLSTHVHSERITYIEGKQLFYYLFISRILIFIMCVKDVIEIDPSTTTLDKNP